MAAGAVTCLACLAWPYVGKARREWHAYCLERACSSKAHALGDSRAEAVERWNQLNERIKL